jgi:hypothetical protein
MIDMGIPVSDEERERWAKQKASWDAHVVTSLAKNVCPYSGLEGPECKSWLCDCFEFEDLWGVSQK